LCHVPLQTATREAPPCCHSPPFSSCALLEVGAAHLYSAVEDSTDGEVFLSDSVDEQDVLIGLGIRTVGYVIDVDYDLCHGLTGWRRAEAGRSGLGSTRSQVRPVEPSPAELELSELNGFSGATYEAASS